MRQKKAQSHIEAIISFFIFITFIIFLFFVFNPLRKNIDQEIPNTIFLNLKENLTSSVTSVSIRISESSLAISYPCLSIIDVNNIISDIGCSGSEKNMTIKNKNGNIMDFRYNSGEDKLFIGNYLGEFYTIYCSDKIAKHEATLTGCLDYESGRENYSVGIVTNKEVWAESDLNKLEYIYTNEYKSIKDKFAPANIDFSFVIVDEAKNELFKGIREAPKGVNIYTQINSIDIMDSNAVTKKGVINIIVW